MGNEVASQNANLVLDFKDGKYSVIDAATGIRHTKWITRSELNRAIDRSATAVKVAQAVGEEPNPILKMVSEQQQV
ncbi:hypothetical protein [Glutamicibacter sp. NPDC087344]|uniref:hypothetical protein n=1 Tax=Glutamicibacter sp. NPDC087344 TaxID=3363994 RepID=UPI0038205BDD